MKKMIIIQIVTHVNTSVNSAGLRGCGRRLLLLFIQPLLMFVLYELSLVLSSLVLLLPLLLPSSLLL